MGSVSMKVECLQGAPPHLQTQTSYAGTRDNTQRRAYMPATIAVARSLVRHMQWCGQCVSALGRRVKGLINALTLLIYKFFLF